MCLDLEFKLDSQRIKLGTGRCNFY